MVGASTARLFPTPRRQLQWGTKRPAGSCKVPIDERTEHCPLTGGHGYCTRHLPGPSEKEPDADETRPPPPPCRRFLRFSGLVNRARANSAASGPAAASARPRDRAPARPGHRAARPGRAPPPGAAAPAPEEEPEPPIDPAPPAGAAAAAARRRGARAGRPSPPIAEPESPPAAVIPDSFLPTLMGPIGLYHISTAEVGPVDHLRLGAALRLLQELGLPGPG